MSFRALAARAGPVAHAASRPAATLRSSIAMAHQARSLYEPGSLLPPLLPEASKIRELPGDETNDVVFESKYGLRTVVLNRPSKLNSLNGSMIRKIVPRLVEWEKSDLANVVVMKGAGEKALCAGGDVVALALLNQEGPEGQKQSADYFALEYGLDHLIATYGKPYISFMDGITMGGGVGLSIHAPFRIATEKTVFAMPETTIGFFPDVGASFFLPRLNGSIGTYLALTSDRLSGPNVFYTGIATHYLHSTSLPDLEGRLAELRFSDDATMQERLDLIDDALDEFSTGLPYDQPMQLSGELRRAIDRCFSKDTVEEIIEALESETGETHEWAREQIRTLKKRSPTSVHVALRQLRTSGSWDIAKTFENEYQIASQFMRHPDFVQGVMSLLAHKTKPMWEPRSITDGATATEPFFQFSKEKQLQLLSERSYPDYPFTKYGVPSEKDVELAVKAKKKTPAALQQMLVAQRRGRQGISEVVQEILSRKTRTDAQGKAVWVDEGGNPVQKPSQQAGESKL